MKKKLSTATILLTGLLLHHAAHAQTNTQVVTRNSGNTQPVQSDFPQQTWEYPPQIADRWIAGYNTSQANRMFLETLQFRLGKGCKVKGANLSVKVRATGNRLQHNDLFVVVHNGQEIFSQKIWNNNDNPNQLKTLNYNFTNQANVLNSMNNGRLSFYIQDDTTVKSASLKVTTQCGGGGGDRPPAQNMPGEHYQCYAVKPTHKTKPETITIADQFGKTQAVLGQAVMLCNPSEKVHKGKHYHKQNPKRHLVCYQLVKHQQPREKKVMTKNQFEGNYLTTRQRQMFCVPSHKEHLK